MKAWFLIGMMALVALAGCASTGGDDESTGGEPGDVEYPAYERLTIPEDPMPEGNGHDHTKVDQHKFLWNYDFSDRDPLQSNAANIAGLHAMDLQNGFLFGAIYGSHAASVDGGLQIWDVQSDPAHPKALGKWTIPGSVGGDRAVGATPDADFAVIGLEPIDCLGHVNPFAAVDAYLVDTRDKDLPIVADVVTLGGQSIGDPTNVAPSIGQHSVWVHRIKDVDYAFLFGDIYRIDRTETGGSLVHVGAVSTGHDIYLVDTPWNTTWALSANGSGGLVVYDVTDPTAPVTLAQWDLAGRKELEAAGTSYYFHTADATFLPQGQILVLLSSEDWTDHVSPYWLLDGNALRGMTAESAPDEPVQLDLLGSWQNPGDHTAIGTSFSLHNPQFHDAGLMTITSYHGGFWQFDFRNPASWAEPSPMAYGVYAEGEPAAVLDPAEEAIENAQCKLGIKMDTPTYMDLAVGPNGTLYMADVFMGLYTFTPASTHPVFGTETTAA